MPEYVVERAADTLNEAGKAVRGSRVLVYGVAYKRDVTDVRESPAFDVLLGLEKRGARVEYMDPHVPSIADHGLHMSSVDPASSFAPYDLVIVVTDHSTLDAERLLREAVLILDTRDSLRNANGDRSKARKL